MDWFIKQKNPLSFSKELINFEPLTHRFRIWNYRIIWIFLKNKNVFLIADIEHRDKVYL